MQKRAFAACALALAGFAGGATRRSSFRRWTSPWTRRGATTRPRSSSSRPDLREEWRHLDHPAGRHRSRSAAHGPVVAGSTLGTPGALVITQTSKIIASRPGRQPDHHDDGRDRQRQQRDRRRRRRSDRLRGRVGRPATSSSTTTRATPRSRRSTRRASRTRALGRPRDPRPRADEPQQRCGIGFGRCTVEGLTVPGFPVADCDVRRRREPRQLRPRPVRLGAPRR